MDYSKIKAELEAKLEELRSREQAVENRLRQPGDADWEEAAAQSKDDEVLARIGDATAAEMHEVQLALNRLKAGTYGICVSCGKPIAPERLEALPFATSCIKCA